ncbi:hypothetical protein H181DRAFT_00134 [Streptomyces sp. WMMB 714]|uniref:hypothetical protein n=1 Tax=Streptomyces sp. WMMB 714 TaxID=1286822 RepID=UPI000697E5BC|nr:hypothetical protein [Streptomyces sp. WMMB 714]SCK06010.1 hypothetical protein H181DRAFT_00134 [Streptomyces sp. WMMB 714]
MRERGTAQTSPRTGHGTERGAQGASRPVRHGRLTRAGRLAVRSALGFPLALAAVPMALLGSSERAASAQRTVLRRWGPGELPAPRGGTGAARTLRHSAAVALPSAACFGLVALSAVVVFSGYLYGFRPDASYGAFGHPFTPDHAFDRAWGGPTLAGAWAVHALAAFGIQLVCLLAAGFLTRLQDRASERLLGRREDSGTGSAH